MRRCHVAVVGCAPIPNHGDFPGGYYCPQCPVAALCEPHSLRACVRTVFGRSRLRADTEPGRLQWRLLLPVPRVALRRVGPHSQRPGARQPRGSAVRVRRRRHGRRRLTRATRPH